MLRRFAAYLDRRFAFRARVDELRDACQRPQTPTATVWLAVFGMFALRLRSFNALEQELRRPNRWDRWVGGRTPSADTVGRVLAQCSIEALRHLLVAVTRLAWRRKAIHARPAAAYRVVAVDGHELWASRARCCASCLVRSVLVGGGRWWSSAPGCGSPTSPRRSSRRPRSSAGGMTDGTWRPEASPNWQASGTWITASSTTHRHRSPAAHARRRVPDHVSVLRTQSQAGRSPAPDPLGPRRAASGRCYRVGDNHRLALAVGIGLNAASGSPRPPIASQPHRASDPLAPSHLSPLSRQPPLLPTPQKPPLPLKDGHATLPPTEPANSHALPTRMRNC